MRLVDRVYGRPRGGVAAVTAHDLAAWVRRDRVLAVATAWAIAVVAAAVMGGAAVRTVASMTYTLIALYALHLLTVEVGVPSLGQAAFGGVGAYGVAVLRGHGVPALTATGLAVMVAAGIGWGLGSALSRLAPAFTALVTWAFGWLFYLSLPAFSALTGGAVGLPVAPLEISVGALGIELTFGAAGHLALGTAVLAGLVLVLRSATATVGEHWPVMRSSPALARALGRSVETSRRRAFVAAAAAAAAAGALSAQLWGAADPSSASPDRSLLLLAGVLAGAPLGFMGPVVGLGVIAVVPTVAASAAGLAGLPPVAGQGLFAALAVVLALAASTAWPRRGGRLHSAFAGPDHFRFPRPGAPLRVSGVRRAFGGVRALDGVDLEVEAGEVHGVMGPNGSGKSTLLGCISGATPVDGGRVVMDARRLDGVAETARVEAGLVRTFQQPPKLSGITVDRALAAARRPERRMEALRRLLQTPAARDGARRRAGERAAVAFRLGLDRDTEMGRLSAGDARRWQLGAALLTTPRVLLLDEPAAGLGEAERDRLAEALRWIAASGSAVVVVEHNLAFLRRVCRRVTVLDAGRVLATGTVDEVSADPAVRAAYLGSPA
jgi:branched-chain amino acid transport system permease protein